MNQFLLFLGETYYPLGGWQDFYGAYSSVSQAVAVAEHVKDAEWWHVIDVKTRRVVAEDTFNAERREDGPFTGRSQKLQRKLELRKNPPQVYVPRPYPPILVGDSVTIGQGF